MHAAPSIQQKSSSGSLVSINMTWRKGGTAPSKMSSPYNAVADRTALYIRLGNRNVYAFTISTSSWSKLPDSPTYHCPSVIVNNLLTLVGGNHKGVITNQLFSLTGKGSKRGWTEEFPEMPTKRYGSTALCSRTTLIVAGGRTKDSSTLQTVEVLNIEILQWSTAANLPHPLYRAQGAICSDHVYFMSLQRHPMSMYTCSVRALIQSYKSTSKAKVWYEVGAPPVTNTTCVSILGHLLTIGGMGKLTAAVHLYNPNSNSWEVVSHMATPRSDCFATVLPNNQLMVVGGWTDQGVTDSVELATVEPQ